VNSVSVPVNRNVLSLIVDVVGMSMAEKWYELC
jgi:hypothetical protein